MLSTARTVIWFLIVTVISSIALIPLWSLFGKQQNIDLPGVAFSLSPDYGTAAVYFSDGSNVAIARVEGNAAYKAFMRRNDVRPSQCKINYIERFVDALPSKLCPNGFPLNSNDSSSKADKAAVTSLLQVLKAAAESYLGNSIYFANVASPCGRLNDNYQNNIIERAVHQIGLVGTMDIAFAGVTLAMIGAGIKSVSEHPKLILVVDYSRYGFNLHIFCEEDGVFEEHRHHLYLHSHSNQISSRRHLIQTALENITKPPFEDTFSFNKLPVEIEELVLHGDDIDDPEFQQVLATVVDQRLIFGAYKQHPLYSTAVGLAENTFLQLNDPFRRKKKAQFGCCWKSGGKGCPQDIWQ
ncbi:hypothetical protein HG530_007777 [Fusarium avenaceum]|nr:hypothetical protein HG530_007777 [Fusarium avenaceum]